MVVGFGPALGRLPFLGIVSAVLFYAGLFSFLGVGYLLHWLVPVSTEPMDMTMIVVMLLILLGLFFWGGDWSGIRRSLGWHLREALENSALWRSFN